MTKWPSRRIKELGRVVTGKTPPKDEPHYFDGEELFVSPKDLDWDQLYVTQTETRVSSKALEKFRNQVISKNSVMFTSLSFGFGKMGIASRASLTNQQINSVVVNKENDFRFVYYLLKACTPFIFAYNSGIDTPIVPKSVFERIELKCPDFRVQRKLAAVLWTCDQQIENNKRRIALLEKLAEEIYREWFVRLRFPGHEKVKLIKGIPHRWRVSEVKELASINPSSISRRDKPESILYVDIRSVSTNRIDEVTPYASAEAPGRARRRVKHGDVIWSSVRPANRACCLIYDPPENLIVSTGFAVIRPNPAMPFTFMFFAVTSNPFVDQMTTVAKGAAYPATSFDDFEKAKLLVPTDDLLKMFHEKCEPLFSQKHLLLEQNQNLERSRNLLLPRLISGKLSVENLDIRFPPSMTEESNAETTAIYA
jgi:type I restriction enzyme, S subunit